jgi:hypothetical protein
MNTAVREETANEASWRQWMNLLPRQSSNSSRSLAAQNPQRFFQLGWEVVDSKVAAQYQQVISKLSEETGLAIIKLSLDRMVGSENEKTTSAISKTPFFPFIEQSSSGCAQFTNPGDSRPANLQLSFWSQRHAGSKCLFIDSICSM